MRVICLVWSFVFVSLRMSVEGTHRMGNNATVVTGLGINGCTGKDKKNKEQIDKAGGWSEAEKIKEK